MNQKQSPRRSSWFESNRVLLGLGVAFVVIASITAYLTFRTVRSLVASWNLTDLPGIAISNQPTPLPGEPPIDPETPLQSLLGPTPEAWDGASRVTILMMGLDYRDWESNQGAPRTDTMILLTIDPLTRTGGMLSIPRDLWVNIPGFEPNKINTAYRLGEVYELPGGGPGLAIETVEQLLGVPINYYALIDFSAFVRFIDEIEGVKLIIPEEIVVDPIGPNNTKTLKPGEQVLPGDLALAYARARNTDGGDFDRADRQQQVILAIRNRIIRFEMMPKLISKAPVLYQEVASGIATNLNLEEAIKLGVLALQIQSGEIKTGVIDTDHVTFDSSPEGLFILKPIPDKIRLLRDDIFTSDKAASPAAVASDPTELVEAEDASVAVLNGTITAGLASKTTEYLQSLDINVTATGNADQSYQVTTIIDYSGKPYTLQYLVDALGLSTVRIFSRFDPQSEVDVAINLGDDWAAGNNLP